MPPQQRQTFPLSTLAWVLIPVIAALFFSFVWIVAIAFIALAYVKRSGDEPRWYNWMLHVCALLMLLRIFGQFYMMAQVSRTPPPIVSREQFIEDHMPWSIMALPDWRYGMAALNERVQDVREIERGDDTAKDPFSGEPLRSIREGDLIKWYSVGPDQIDQELSIEYDGRNGVLSEGDVPAYSLPAMVYDGATSPTGTAE